jgi:hypothetical protein
MMHRIRSDIPAWIGSSAIHPDGRTMEIVAWRDGIK